MDRVTVIRGNLAVNLPVAKEDIRWLTDKLESLWYASDNLKNKADDYITALEKAADGLKADLLVQEMSKDIEIHELKERLKQYEPDTDSDRDPAPPA